MDASEGAVVLGGDGTEEIQLDLPIEGASEELVDGRTILGGDDIEIAVAPVESGTQVIHSVAIPEAPQTFDFSLDGVSLQLNSTGGVDVLDTDGSIVGLVESPWAYDANGLVVPTYFEVDGSVLTQVVTHHKAGYAYPIVADPTVKSCEYHTSWCVKFTKNETKSIALKCTGIGIAGASAFLCSKTPYIVGAAVCVGLVAGLGSALRDSFVKARKMGSASSSSF